MALGDTFDLGRAYTQAQGVKNMQSELSWRQQLMTDKKKTTEETAHLQEKYAMWRASDKDPALRAQILAEARQNGGPQLANVPDDALAQYIEAGFEQKLNLKKTDVGTLYATGEDGTYLPASQAVGKKKYEKPDKPDKPPAPASPQHVQRYIKKDGKDMVQHGSYDPSQPVGKRYTWEDPVETVPRANSGFDWGPDAGGDQTPPDAASAPPPPMARNPKTGEVVYYVNGQWVKNP
jgi:hypothetical protein